MPNSRLRAALIDDHIVPYRRNIFNLVFQTQTMDLKVFYSTRRLREREWEIDENDIRYPFRILPSLILRLVQGRFHEPRSIIFPPTLFFELVAFDPDVVVGYAFSVPAIQAALYCFFFRKSYVSWATGTSITEKDYSPFQLFLRRQIVRFAKAFITASQQGADHFAQLGADPSKVRVVLQVPDPAFTHLFDEILSKHQQTYSIENHLSPPVILFVGFLSERKGVRHLLEAFASVHQTFPAATLLLVGDGPLRDSLKQRAVQLGIANAVHFAGFIQPDDLPHVYCGAAVFVLPTLADNFGVVLAEAATCCLPLISTPYAGASDHLIEPAVNGFIVDPEDHRALADSISRILRKEERTQMGVVSRHKVSANPLSKSAEQLIDAIQIARGRPQSE